MKARILAASALGAVTLASIGGAALAAKGPEPVAPPVVADNFRLVDQTGFAQELRRLVDAKAIVLVSQVNGDKGSRRAAAQLHKLRAAYPGVEFMMLNSDPADGRDEIAAEAASQGYAIPVLDDDVQLVGEQLGVSYAGEAFLIQPKTLKVLYHGPVDAAGARKKTGGYLAAALDDVLAGRPVASPAVAGKGKSIAFPQRSDASLRQPISYTADVAPILAAKCVACHQEGGIGPFAMSSYQTVKAFAPMIREAVRTRTMPPWHPDPEVGKFVNDHSLSRDQARTLVHWVEAGAPRGDGGDPLAETRREAPQWQLGQPDQVIDIPDYQVPASGVVEYQYPVAANPGVEGRWVRAAELMPGDRRAVHHILAGYIPGSPRPGPGSASQWEASYGEYAVGGEAFEVPKGMGIYLPPGGAMGFQMHYTPYGKDAVDHSKMGLYFYPKGETPERILRHFVIADSFIELPPNDPHHKETAYAVFPKDAVLHSVFLHTHYRGLAGRVDLILPDGSRKELINLPRYDFNWQRTYQFAEPVKIPAGAKLLATYVYDNSVRNSANPDPDATVVWGDQSWEEMHYTSIYYEWADETAAKPADASKQLGESRMLGMLDDDLDGKIEEAELHGRVATALKPRFAALDANKDGGIDQAELKVAAGPLMKLVADERAKPNVAPPTRTP